MTDRQIMFTAAMVKALLAGTKTQTRRLITKARVFATPDRPAWTLRGEDLARALQNADRFRHMGEDSWFWEADAFEWQAPATRTGWLAHIGYAPGDRLWGREAWASDAAYDDLSPSEMGGEEPILYIADGAHQTWGYPAIAKVGRPRPGMFMPRWASRLTLIVTDVRVQRLQEISEADALAEGIDQFAGKYRVDPDDWDGWFHNAADAYRFLWDRLNAKRAPWERNPFVIAVTFRPILKNIDQLEIHHE